MSQFHTPFQFSGQKFIYCDGWKFITMIYEDKVDICMMSVGVLHWQVQLTYFFPLHGN